MGSMEVPIIVHAVLDWHGLSNIQIDYVCFDIQFTNVIEADAVDVDVVDVWKELIESVALCLAQTFTHRETHTRSHTPTPAVCQTKSYCTFHYVTNSILAYDD